MIKINFCPILLFITSLVSAQDSIELNVFDSLGLKQGFWIELEAKPEISSITHLDLADGTSDYIINYDFDNYYVLKYKGYYENGLRNGVWDVYLASGEKRYIINYRKGTLYGDFIIYYLTGEVKLKGFIEKRPFTTVSYYDDKGKFMKEEVWFTKGLVEKLYR